MLIGGEPDGKIIALDKRTGESWRSLVQHGTRLTSRSSSGGGTRQLIIFILTDSALDPATGKVYWEIEHRVQMGIVVSPPVQSGSYLFFTSQYGGARMLRLDGNKPAATLLWQGLGEQDPGMTHDTPNTLNSVISTPVIDHDYVYGIDNDGNRAGRRNGKAGLENRRPFKGTRDVRHGVLRSQRRSLLYQQRSWRTSDREALAEGIRRDRSDETA
jgi:hypothetical protein